MADIFKALGNDNRRNMLRLLIKKDFHVSGIAKELNIAVPVALKHANVLEEVGLIEKRKVGNTHVLKLSKEALKKLEKIWDLFEKPLVVEVEKNTSMLDALRKVSGLKVEKREDGVYITSVDGKPGYYIYEVDGKLPNKPADQFLIKKNLEVELKKLLPVVGKKVVIKVK